MCENLPYCIETTVLLNCCFACHLAKLVQFKTNYEGALLCFYVCRDGAVSEDDGYLWR